MGETLDGGVANQGQVTREGDFVLRPAPNNAPTIHRLLNHLAARDLPVPRPVEMRDDGKEMVGFIPGEVSVSPYAEPWIREERTLVALGRFLRKFHDATVGFMSNPTDVWSTELADPGASEVICHNDVCIENVVFRDGLPVGLLDFDFAAPGRRGWDVAMTARYWVPLLDPVSASATGRDHLDPIARLATFVEAYGLDADDRASFASVLMDVEEVALEFVMRRVENGDSAFVEMWKDLGAQERYARKMEWLNSQQPALAKALGV